jgi:hypothetical protein
MLDYPPILARFETMCNALRNCVGCAGCLDEETAAKILKYLKRHADDPNLRHHGPSERMIDDFVLAHGQSLDWLLCDGDMRHYFIGGARHSPRGHLITEAKYRKAA